MKDANHHDLTEVGCGSGLWSRFDLDIHPDKPKLPGVSILFAADRMGEMQFGVVPRHITGIEVDSGDFMLL